MYKTTTFFKTAAMTVLLFMGMITAQAAVTYRLTTHPVFGETREITASANLSAGADLLDNMPQALWRAYTTYKFYSDAELTEEITEVPAANATVYVDYEFLPAYVPSPEDGDPIWHYLRGYNASAETSTGNQYLLYKMHSKNEVWGFKSVSGSIPKAGDNYPMAHATHCQWALYGDGFNCQIKLNDDAAATWLIWGGTSGKQEMKLGARPAIGWQLYTNTAKNARISGGTVCLGVPNTTNYLYNLEDPNGQCTTRSLDTSKQKFDSKNRLVNVKQGTTSNKDGLWWYAMFATPVEEKMTPPTNLYRTIYKIIMGYQNFEQRGEDIYVKKGTSPEVPALPEKYKLENTEEVKYVYCNFKDPELLEPWMSGETMPVDETTIVYVLEDRATTTNWKTLCVPFDVEDLAAGSFDGNPVMEVWEYTSVTTESASKVYYSFNLHFTQTETIREGYPYLYRFVNVPESMLEKWEAELVDWKDAVTDEDKAKITEVSFVDEAFPEAKVTMVGTYDNFVLTPMQNDTDPYYFYFGYNAKEDAYKFYPVKTKNVTMKPFQCYFFASGTEGNSVSIAMDGATDGISEVTAAAKNSAVGVYNLSGQRMNSNNLPAGVYIVNGKKMVVK